MRGKFTLACALCAAALVSAETATSHAQGAAQTPTPNATGSAGDTKPDEPLSKKLNKNDGVLKPPENVDPGIHQPAPSHTGDDMPVIVPPGEPGGDQSVQPK